MKTYMRIYGVVTLLVSLWCIGIIAVPLLKHAGWIQTADVLYSFFARVCHQDDARSFHIEGEKIGVCIRCSGIYFGFLLGLISLPLSHMIMRKNFPAVGFFFFAVVPMAVDVVLNTAGIHSCTPVTRIATGASFGISTAWFIFPIFIEACVQLFTRNNIRSLETGAVQYVRKTQ